MNELEQKIEDLYQKNQHQQIIDVLEKTTVTPENNFFIHNELGRAFNNMGNDTDEIIWFQKAEKVLLKSLEIEPNNTDALYRYAYTTYSFFIEEIQTQDYMKKTYDLCKKCISIDPKHDKITNIMEWFSERRFEKTRLIAMVMDNRKDYLNILTSNQIWMHLFNIFTYQVKNGGFIQLIQNGYGPIIFESPFTTDAKSFLSDKCTQLIEKAKEIYLKNKEAITQETTREEFSKLYLKFPEFDPLEKEFYAIEIMESLEVAYFIFENKEEMKVDETIIDKIHEKADEEYAKSPFVNKHVSKDNKICSIYMDTGHPTVMTLGEKMEEICDEAYMNGYNWDAFFKQYLMVNNPDLLENANFDPEAGSFYAYYPNSEENQKRWNALHQIIENVVNQPKETLEFLNKHQQNIEWD